jgi:hypothetical protein
VLSFFSDNVTKADVPRAKPSALEVSTAPKPCLRKFIRNFGIDSKFIGSVVVRTDSLIGVESTFCIRLAICSAPPKPRPRLRSGSKAIAGKCIYQSRIDILSFQVDTVEYPFGTVRFVPTCSIRLPFIKEVWHFA